MTFTSFNAEKKKIYATRLQAVNRTGLSIDSFQAAYILQYANSLIGRQLKILAQVNAFIIYDLVNEDLLLFTHAVGELAALFWFPEIRNMDTYLVSDVKPKVHFAYNLLG